MPLPPGASTLPCLPAAQGAAGGVVSAFAGRSRLRGWSGVHWGGTPPPGALRPGREQSSPAASQLHQGTCVSGATQQGPAGLAVLAVRS